MLLSGTKSSVSLARRVEVSFGEPGELAYSITHRNPVEPIEPLQDGVHKFEVHYSGGWILRGRFDPKQDRAIALPDMDSRQSSLSFEPRMGSR